MKIDCEIPIICLIDAETIQRLNNLFNPPLKFKKPARVVWINVNPGTYETKEKIYEK